MNNKKVNVSVINKLKQLEKFFSQNNYMGDLLSKNIFTYKENKSFVCLTAPHSTKSTVHKICKKSDCFTGSLAKYIATKNKFSFIVRNRFFNKKNMIISFIEKNNLENHYFIEIHAMKEQPFDLAVGIGYSNLKNYQKEITFIKKLCKKFKLSFVINHPSYTGQIGLVGRFQKKYNKTNVIQLEWTKKYRDFYNYPENIEKITIPFITTLSLFLNTLKKDDYIKVKKFPKFIQKIKNRIIWFLQK